MSNLIILPVYNESINLGKMLESLLDLSAQFDILVIEDNSPDGAGIIADKYAKLNNRIKVIHREKKLGLATAYSCGFNFALNNGYEHVITMDCDFSHNPMDIPGFINEAEKSFELIIGSRYIRGVRIKSWSFRRLLLSKLANFYASTMLGTKLSDLTSGFRCYKTTVFNKIDVSSFRSKGYAFQIEIVYKILRKRMKIKEIPIVFTDRQGGVSKMSLKIVIEAFWVVILMKLFH